MSLLVSLRRKVCPCPPSSAFRLLVTRVMAAFPFAQRHRCKVMLRRWRRPSSACESLCRLRSLSGHRGGKMAPVIPRYIRDCGQCADCPRIFFQFGGAGVDIHCSSYPSSPPLMLWAGVFVRHLFLSLRNDQCKKHLAEMGSRHPPRVLC